MCNACTCTCAHMYVGIHLRAPVTMYSHAQRCQRPIYVFLDMCPFTSFTGAESVLNLKLTFLAIQFRSPVFISQVLVLLHVDYQTLLAFFFIYVCCESKFLSSRLQNMIALIISLTKSRATWKLGSENACGGYLGCSN